MANHVQENLKQFFRTFRPDPIYGRILSLVIGIINVVVK